MNLLFASKNKHKLAEIKKIFICAGLNDINFQSIANDDRFQDIPEDFDTLEENATAKAEFVYNITKTNVFADDTGLEIKALNGRPGVYSARYAGENCDFHENVLKVLKELEGVNDRRACFRTVICLILEGKKYLFEGRVEGEILTYTSGKGGFGYDPVFKPEGYDLTYAEMPMDEKNHSSHRAVAMQKMMNFLKEYSPID